MRDNNKIIDLFIMKLGKCYITLKGTPVPDYNNSIQVFDHTTIYGKFPTPILTAFTYHLPNRIINILCMF